MDDTALNQAQLDVMRELGARPAERPSFRSELRHELRALLEDGIGPHLELLPDDETLWVSKRKLAAVHGCEANYAAEADFEWSVPVARGMVAHKAIELSVFWRREIVPLTLVDEALGRFEEGTDDFARWLQGCREVERAELRAEATERVTKFVECWPPLKKEWRPTVESPVKTTLGGDRVTLSGKVDLQLGQAQGLTAGKVLVDFKTGRVSPNHLNDLRFYALIDTLRTGTPPRRLASYYLDHGRFAPEDVTEVLLEAAAARVIDGIRKMVELAAKVREPRKVTGPACRWCPLIDSCDEGRRFVSGDDDENAAEMDLDL